MGVAEAVTEDDVDVSLLLRDPRAALLPMLTKVRGWEEVCTPARRHRTPSADIYFSMTVGGPLSWACATAASQPMALLHMHIATHQLLRT